MRVPIGPEGLAGAAGLGAAGLGAAGLGAAGLDADTDMSLRRRTRT